jgi:hypothetical protein
MPCCDKCKKSRQTYKCTVCDKQTCDRCGLNVGDDDGPWACTGGGKCHFTIKQKQMTTAPKKILVIRK